MTRLTLAAALALGLAAAPQAQQRTAAADADVPGAVVDVPAAPALSFVDDQDPLARASARPALAPMTAEEAARRADGAVFSDADDPAFPMAFPAPVHLTTADDLDDGRDASVLPVLRLAPSASAVEAVLDDGRTAEAVQAAMARGPFAAQAEARPAEALDNGRAPGTRPGPVAVGDAGPLVASSPLVDAAAPSEGLSLSVVQPNPARTEAWVTASVASPTRATVTVYDVQGREVARAFDGLVSAEAPARVRLELGSLSAGTYVVVLAAGDARSSQTLQVVR